MDKGVKKFFDYIFKNAVFESDFRFEGAFNSWSGFIIEEKGNNILIVGYPNDSDPRNWYSDGAYLNKFWTYLDISGSEFHELMKEYISDKYGFNISTLY